MNEPIVHKPVLLQKVVRYLKIDPEGTYVDCTLGDGGYSTEILKHLSGGRLISMDIDKMSVDFVTERYRTMMEEKNWVVVQENFADIRGIIESLDVAGVHGVVFDLGLSSRQLDADAYERGFSFRKSEKADMRMDTRKTVAADDLLKVVGEKQLAEILRQYGEERYAKRIAHVIKDWVKQHPNKILTSDRLAALVRKVVPAGYRKGSKHPARRVFQALRIAVNDELHNLQKGIDSALSVVLHGGRVVVVSYHSLEDRIVKQTFRSAEEEGLVKVLTGKPVVPSEEEIEMNNRARSAKLRAVEIIRPGKI